MLYSVYTDGAGSDVNNVVGCAYCIITDTSFIQAGCTKLTGMNNPTHAETISVGLALSHILSKLKVTNEDTIRVNTDCMAVISFCESYMNNDDPIRSNVSAVRSTIKVVREAHRKCNLKFNKVKAHKGYLNPNTYVDRLAKLAIWR